MERDTSFDKVLKLVQQLSPEEKRRLIERVEPEAAKTVPSTGTGKSRSLLGLVKDLGPAPSEEEIDAARREAWKNFPREDI